MPETPTDFPNVELHVGTTGTLVITAFAIYGATTAVMDVSRVMRNKLNTRKIRRAMETLPLM